MAIATALNCSYNAVLIGNRFLHHPETLQYIDRPNQLPQSSKIGPIEDGGSAFKWRPQTPASGRPALPSRHPANQLGLSPSSLGVGWADRYRGGSPGIVPIDW